MRFKERMIDNINIFSVFRDTVHRGGQAFLVALGIDMTGEITHLVFLTEATENRVICEQMLKDR